jgi:hypothetical protein
MQTYSPQELRLILYAGKERFREAALVLHLLVIAEQVSRHLANK